MTIDFVSIAVITLISAITPIVVRLVPGRAVPGTVFLLLLGALLGPNMAGLINVDDTVSFLSDLGLGFLFLMAGYEIDTRNLTGHQGKRGLATWVVSLALAFAAIHFVPEFADDHIMSVVAAIAVTTTALGTIMPIMKERGLPGTAVGDSILSYGTWGELGPIVAIALLLSTRTAWVTIAVLLGFCAIAVLIALSWSRMRKANKRFENLLREDASTSQPIIRFVIFLLVFLLACSALFNLDIVLGAFAAGFVLRYIVPEGNTSMETKLDSIAYGFFIPLFFVVSGTGIDLAAVALQPLLLLAFIAALLLFRALPILIALSTDRDTRSMTRNSRISVALYCTTALPLIVAVTAIAVKMDAMSNDTASVLVCAGAVTVFLMPLLGSIAYRVSDAKPIVAVREMINDPRDAGRIVRDHINRERQLEGKEALTRDRERMRFPSFRRHPMSVKQIRGKADGAAATPPEEGAQPEVGAEAQPHTDGPSDRDKRATP